VAIALSTALSRVGSPGGTPVGAGRGPA
jgi:cytosine permease